MSLDSYNPSLHGYQPTQLHGCPAGPYDTITEAYEFSVGSSAPSTQESVFSDSGSADSSIASSISDDFRLSRDDLTKICSQQYSRDQAEAGHAIAAEQQKLQCPLRAQAPSYADFTSLQLGQRPHPRRTSLARHQKPPPLVRQCERKINFVDNLVDSATQMVEVIWPLSVVPCRSEGASGRGVLPLRTYIEETLRRSRSSYSTLQVALYYLLLIKPFVPKCDFTMELPLDCPASRALMCGRRMFLAALILASKYLQDRNYSAKAWSKMSGLKVCEINTNERMFLGKVNWKLHIPDPTFKRWQDIVLRYTPSMHPPSPGSGCPTWKNIVVILTPKLDTVPIPETRGAPQTQHPTNYGFGSPVTPTPTRNMLCPMQVTSTSQETTPTPSTILPRFLEPKTELPPPPTPALARMGPLPTPVMTPSSVASSTPAVSAISSSRRPSICNAMSTAQKAALTRCSMDAFPITTTNAFPLGYQPASRRPSISTASSGSSPESMISDRSRASSISSVSTTATSLSLAPTRACLARQATCRNVHVTRGGAGMIPPFYYNNVVKINEEEKEGSSPMKPILIVDQQEGVICVSPESVDFTPTEKGLLLPHRHSKHAPHPVSLPTGRKRARPRGGRRSLLQEEVRLLLAEEMEEMDVVSDSEEVESSSAVQYANNMLACSAEYDEVEETKEGQPSPYLAGKGGSVRVPVVKGQGKKRTCCSASAEPMLYGEV